MLRSLDRLQEVTISKDGREMTLRTPATGLTGPLFSCPHRAAAQRARGWRRLILAHRPQRASPCDEQPRALA